jgi:hypothetical protein
VQDAGIKLKLTGPRVNFFLMQQQQQQQAK